MKPSKRIERRQVPVVGMSKKQRVQIRKATEGLAQLVLDEVAPQIVEAFMPILLSSMARAFKQGRDSR